MATEPAHISRSLSAWLQALAGLTLLLGAVSTSVEVQSETQIDIHVLDGVTARFLLPTVIMLILKALVALAGSALLLRHPLFKRHE